jgi:hypothetical protein
MANSGGIQQGSAAAAGAKEAASRHAEPAKKPSGYGLPCAKCHAYYLADLDCCPICQSRDRVSPVTSKAQPKSAQTPAEPAARSVADQEREEFLKQFKAQLREAHAEAGHAPGTSCKFQERHSGEAAGAEVCSACYERLQERVDVLEASLHIDLKEAAQIIYDAVWADPSKPSKTYQNAASALLNELRKRGGVTTVMGSFQPLKH